MGEKKRHVLLRFSGEEKIMELLKLQSYFKKLQFKDVAGSTASFADLSSKKRWIGGYQTEYLLCTLLPQSMYNWSTGRVWSVIFFPSVKIAIAVLAGCFYVTELQEDLLDSDSGITASIIAGWHKVEDDVGVGP